jgi:predicted RNase H-like nuclease (RuvC/YqgF family)
MNSFERILLGTVLGALATAAWADPPLVKCVTPEEHKQQFQKDVALLERYPSEDDLQEARYRALGDPIKRVSRANERLKELIAKARDFSEKAKFFEAPHRMPDDLRKDRDFNRELEQIEFQHIAGAAHDIERINDQYDAQLKRYRELVNGTAKMPCVLKND